MRRASLVAIIPKLKDIDLEKAWLNPFQALSFICNINPNVNTMLQLQVIHIAINPGDSYEYTVYINETVSPGNYWYHPHLTGDTESAIQGGATGSIVIAGLQNLQPAVQGLPERVFLLRDFLTPDSVANNTDAPAWDISINYVPIPFTAGYPPAIIEMMPDEVQVCMLL